LHAALPICADVAGAVGVEVGVGALRPEDATEHVGVDDGPHFPGNDQRDGPPTEDVALPVPRASRQDLRDEGDGSRAAQADVEEPGPGDDDLADPALPEQMRAQDAGHPLRGLTGGPGELAGDTGGVVPAPPATR